MNPSSCASVSELLPWFVGDDLDGGRSEAVRAHLRDCSTCRREAASLQQSTKVLQSVGAALGSEAMGAVADEATFTAMHEAIAKAVRAEAIRLESSPRSPFVLRWLPLAAALILFATGWSWVQESSSLKLLQRRPIDMPSVEPFTEVGTVRVVPWSGPRVPLQPLGFEVPPGVAAESGVGQGMMGRRRLRERAGELGAMGTLIPPPMPR